jgi:hypothetical protein
MTSPGTRTLNRRTSPLAGDGHEGERHERSFAGDGSVIPGLTIRDRTSAT